MAEVCSGEGVELNFDGILVDDNLDVADASYTWTASVDRSNLLLQGTNCHFQ